MKSILREFANGNISPDVRFFKRNSEYAKAMEALSDNEEKLLSLLNDAEKELLNDLISAQADISELSGVDKFIYGYRLGVLMTIEVFTGKDDLIIGEEDC